jgi:hypothetical protein
VVVQHRISGRCKAVVTRCGLGHGVRSWSPLKMRDQREQNLLLASYSSYSVQYSIHILVGEISKSSPPGSHIKHDNTSPVSVLVNRIQIQTRRGEVI